MNRFGSNSFDNENDQFAQNQQIGRQLADNSPRPWNNQNQHQIPDNRHGSRPNYRPDPVNDIRYYNTHQSGNQYSNHPGHYGRMQSNQPNEGYRHHDTSIWTERNDYKDEDYRYRSGNRNYWHEDYDEQYENRHHRPHPQNFFTNFGQGIREGWNNLFHRHEYDDRNRYEDRSHRNHPYNAYESYRQNPQEHRSNPGSNEWHNSGPDHRDEDFFDRRNFR